MRFITVRDLRTTSSQIWRDLDGEREMVVTRNGRPVAILLAVDEASLDASLRALRRARAIDAFHGMQRGSVKCGTHAMTKGDVDAEVTDVRARRHR